MFRFSLVWFHAENLKKKTPLVFKVQSIWGPFLVIAPASTLHNWQQECARFCPKFKVSYYLQLLYFYSIINVKHIYFVCYGS